MVIDVTIRYESKLSSLVDAVAEKVKKYGYLKSQIQELTNAKNIKFKGFPVGARGKWYSGNYELLKAFLVGNLKFPTRKNCAMYFKKSFTYIG